MRARARIVAITTVGLFIAAVQGCATQVVVPPEDDPVDVPLTDAAKLDSKTDPAPNRPDTSAPDTSVADTSTRVDAQVDASDGAVTSRPGDPFDPLAPKEGDNCPVGTAENTVLTRTCGKCGKQNALCEKNGAGVLKVSAYGACTAEPTTAVCLPGEVIVSTCGFCGQQVKRCDGTCSYIEGACQNQVVGGCPAGEITFLEGLCGPGTTPPSNATDVRRQVCSPSCARGTAEPCAPRPTPEIVVAQTVNGLVATENDVIATKVARLNTGSCPSTLSSTLSTYQWVRVRNSGADSVNVTVTNVPLTGASSTTPVDTVVTYYAGGVIPADRLQCVGTVSDSPESVTVNIAAGGAIMFHQSLYSGSATAAKLRVEAKTNFIGVETPPPVDYTITIGPNLGNSVTQAMTFSAAQKNGLLSMAISGNSTCPRTVGSSLTAYRYVRIINPGATARTVDIYTPSGQDAVIAYYAGATAPLNADRGACTGVTNDTCPSGSIASADACITGVSIPANSSIVAYVGYYSTVNVSPTSLVITTKN